MKNLIRGGSILSILALFVVFIYAQTKTESTPAKAISSQAKIDGNVSDKVLINKNNNKQDLVVKQNLAEKTEKKSDLKDNDDKKEKKLVEKTSSVRAVGASRGSFSATAYCLRGKTAMGHGVRRGLIAADPRVLKLGSTITINAGAYSGTYLVSDTGGGIKGKELDIWMASCSEARKFGRRSVQVFSAQ